MKSKYTQRVCESLRYRISLYIGTVNESLKSSLAQACWTEAQGFVVFILMPILSEKMADVLKDSVS